MGEFNATDPDGDALTYHLVSGAGDADNSKFTIDANGFLRVGGVLDFEAGSMLSVRVQARDDSNASVEGNFTVNLTDVYEDTMGMASDSLEVSTGSDLNDPNSTPLEQDSLPGIPLMVMHPICPAMETTEP